MSDASSHSIVRETRPVPLAELNLYYRNPRRGDISAIAASLARNGQYRAVVVNVGSRTGRPNEVLCGNHTVMSARLLDWDTVDASFVDLDDTEAARVVLADNRTAELATDDSQVLAELLQEFDGDLEGTGWTGEDLDALLAELQDDTATDPGEEPVAFTDDDAIPPAPADTVTRPGDLWLLGPHRLLCGDSTVPADVARAVGDLGPVTMLHADPPYGMGKEADGVLNDNLYREKLDAFQMAWWQAWLPQLAGNGSAYIWGNAPELWRLWYLSGLGDDLDLSLRSQIIWDKPPSAGPYGSPIGSAGMRSYPHGYETCFLIFRGAQEYDTNADNYWEGWEPLRAWLEGERDRAGWTNQDANRVTGSQMASHYFTRSQWSLPTEGMYERLREAARGTAFTRPYEDLRAEYDQLRVEYDRLREEFQASRTYFDNTHENMTDVWDFPRVTGEDRHGHATPKPVAMVQRAFASSSRPGDVIGVPFGGSGPEFIAAHHLDRTVVAVELAPEYCDVIARRFEAHTGITPLLERDGAEPRPVSVLADLLAAAPLAA